MDVIFLILIGVLFSLLCVLVGCSIGYINGYKDGFSSCKEHDDKTIEKLNEKV